MQHKEKKKVPQQPLRKRKTTRIMSNQFFISSRDKQASLPTHSLCAGKTHGSLVKASDIPGLLASAISSSHDNYSYTLLCPHPKLSLNVHGDAKKQDGKAHQPGWWDEHERKIFSCAERKLLLSQHRLNIFLTGSVSFLTPFVVFSLLYRCQRGESPIVIQVVALEHPVGRSWSQQQQIEEDRQAHASDNIVHSSPLTPFSLSNARISNEMLEQSTKGNLCILSPARQAVKTQGGKRHRFLPSRERKTE